MARVSDYITLGVGEGAVAEAKGSRAMHQQQLGDQAQPPHHKDSKLWVGDIGERGFGHWLKDNNTPFIYHGKEKGKDKLDYTVYDKRIDVKTRAISYDPQYNVRIWVWERQADFATKVYPDTLTHYVFAAFNEASLKLYLLGWVSKEDFYAKAKHFNEGDDNKGHKVHKAMYELDAYDLTPMSEILKCQ